MHNNVRTKNFWVNYFNFNLLFACVANYFFVSQSQVRRCEFFSVIFLPIFGHIDLVKITSLINKSPNKNRKLKIYKKIQWCLNRYYSMILSQYYYLVSSRFVLKKLCDTLEDLQWPKRILGPPGCETLIWWNRMLKWL